MTDKAKHKKVSWFWIKEHVDALSLRERSLLFLTMLAAVFYIWKITFFGFYGKTDEVFAKKVAAATESIQALNSQITNVAESIRSDPIIALSNKVEQLKKDNKEVEQKIAKLTEQLIPPREMTKLLMDVLKDFHGLTVLKVQNLDEKPLFDTQGKGKEDKATDRFQVYQHGLEIELEATYFNMQEFLQSLENLQWKLLWDELSYEVEEYPYAKVKLIMHTLSLEQGWISA